jgi:hypothetical protein
VIAKNLRIHWFGRSSPDSYRAGPMSATEALLALGVSAPLAGRLSRLMPEPVKSPCCQPLEPLKLGRTTLASSTGRLQ